MSRIEKTSPEFAIGIIWASVGGLAAQDVDDLCPNMAGDAGVVVGTVTDLDSGMVLPGAEVRITWTGAEGSGETTALTGLDGGYGICGLTLGSEVSLQAAFANVVGTIEGLTISELLERVDLALSLTQAGERDARLLMCPDLEFPQLILCREGWHLERCQYEYLGRIVATRTGAGVDNQDLVERFVEEARRVKADAVIETEGQMRGGLSSAGVAWTRIEGSAIALADKDCRG